MVLKAYQESIEIMHKRIVELEKEEIINKYPGLKLNASSEDFDIARKYGINIECSMGFLIYVFPDGTAWKI